MNVLVLDHHGKSLLLQEALRDTGWLTNDLSKAEIVLADTDHPDAPPILVNGQWCHRQNLLMWAARTGRTVVLYPHGANPQLDYDGLRPAPPWVTLQLVHGQGHKDAYQLIGLQRRVEVVGWTYTTTATDNAEAMGCLFAPIHPWADGKRILPVHQAANEAGYQTFLAAATGRRVVRLWGDDEPNGVTSRPSNVEFVSSDLTIPVGLIDRASHVIGAGTVAYTALARAKTVDLIDDGIPTMNDHGTQTITHWDQIRPMLAHDGSPEWVNRWVGGPFQQERFLELIEEARPNRETRRRLAKAR